MVCRKKISKKGIFEQPCASLFLDAKSSSLSKTFLGILDPRIPTFCGLCLRGVEQTCYGEKKYFPMVFICQVTG
jgi:hypothetical protein